MALIAKFQRKYRKAITGTTVFVYNVSGSEKELADFEAAEGDNYRLDDKTGKPIWFTTRFIDDNISLVITENNKVVADDSELSKMASLVSQFGPEVAKLVLMQKQMKSASAE
jgi:hypothetical protein